MNAEQIHRLGMVLPAANTTLEVELPKWLGDGTSWHFQRFGRMIRTEEDLGPGAQGIIHSGEALVPARVRGIGVGYTAGSFVGGPEWDRRLREQMESACGVPVVTAASAIVEALRHLGASRVAAVSPYAPAVNERLAAYLTTSGYQVRRVVGEPPPGPAGAVPLADVERMVTDLEVGDADVVLISCTGLRTMSLINALEERVARPVVSSNQALAWVLLAGSGREGAGPGSLFAGSQDVHR